MQALMDADGNGTVSQRELLESAKLIMENRVHMQKGGQELPPVGSCFFACKCA